MALLVALGVAAVDTTIAEEGTAATKHTAFVVCPSLAIVPLAIPTTVCGDAVPDIYVWPRSKWPPS
jgi:hypothetical protein